MNWNTVGYSRNGKFIFLVSSLNCIVVFPLKKISMWLIPHLTFVNHYNSWILQVTQFTSKFYTMYSTFKLNLNSLWKYSNLSFWNNHQSYIQIKYKKTAYSKFDSWDPFWWNVDHWAFYLTFNVSNLIVKDKTNKISSV